MVTMQARPTMHENKLQLPVHVCPHVQPLFPQFSRINTLVVSGQLVVTKMCDVTICYIIKSVWSVTFVAVYLFPLVCRVACMPQDVWMYYPVQWSLG